MMLGVEISPSILGGDMLLATHNLGTKLMRWMSSIDCDRVGVSSLTVCQCSDEVEVSPSMPSIDLDCRLDVSRALSCSIPIKV